MYEALLQSADRPFRATPDSKFYFPADSIEQARQTVVRAILRAEGPCLVLGGAGLGKSMLCQVIADDVYGRFDVVKLHATGLCSRRALLQSILFELQLPFRALSEGELRMSIMDRLSPSPETAPNGILLLVDEAHTLSPKLLEELRLITNFARNGQPRARLVLIGNMRLEDTFANPQLDSFNQRLAARCYLQPLTRDQSMEFVRHQLRCVQVEPGSMVTNDALRTLYAASEGVPRLINQVMDHALVLGITSGQCPISASLIEEAWSDLQQLPAPWHTSNAPEKSQSAPKADIEFGELSDDDEAFVESVAAPTAPAIKTKSKSAEPMATAESFGVDTISITTARIQYPRLDEIDSDETESDDMEDVTDSEYKLMIDNDPIEVIAKAPKQNFFAAFAPTISIEATDDDEIELDVLPEDQTVSKLTSTEQTRASDRVVFDASKAFGFNRHQASYPRGTEPVAPSNSRVEPFVKPANTSNASSTNSPFSARTNDEDRYESPDFSNPLAASFFSSHVSDYEILDFERTTDEIIARSPATENVWENDPPIRESRPSIASMQNATSNHPEFTSPRELFGEDFEEEIAIAQKGGVGKDRRIFEPKPLEVAAAMPLAARHAAVTRDPSSVSLRSPPSPARGRSEGRTHALHLARLRERTPSVCEAGEGCQAAICVSPWSLDISSFTLSFLRLMAAISASEEAGCAMASAKSASSARCCASSSARVGEDIDFLQFC